MSVFEALRDKQHMSVLYARIVVCGGPRCGKSTFAEKVLQELMPAGAMLYHLDSLIADHGWSEQSEVAMKYLFEPTPYVVEGCAAVRALRKFLDRCPGKPCDVVVRLTAPL